MGRLMASAPGLHGNGHPGLVVFAPAGVPEMVAEQTVEDGGQNVRQKLNYNSAHSPILLRSPKPMLDNLTQRLARVMKTLKGEARLTETNIADALREVRMALRSRRRPARGQGTSSPPSRKAVGEEVIGSLSPGQALIGVVHRELTKIMGEAHEGISFATQPPAIVPHGRPAGRGQDDHRRQAGQAAREGQKKKVLVVSCDVTVRPPSNS